MIPENYQTILTEDHKDRKFRERKYRGFYFNDDQIQTEEDGRRYIEIMYMKKWIFLVIL